MDSGGLLRIKGFVLQLDTAVRMIPSIMILMWGTTILTYNMTFVGPNSFGQKPPTTT